MRTELPILMKSSFTPKGGSFGITIDASQHHNGVEAAVWIHGLLTLEEGELSKRSEAFWLSSLNIVAISESNQLAMIDSVVGEREFLKRHSFKEKLENGAEVRVIPFSFNVLEVFEEGLYRDNFYLHVSAGKFTSQPVRISKDDEKGRSYLGDPAQSDEDFKHVDSLIKAYDSFFIGNYSDSLSEFESALKSKDVRRDIDRSNLFNAAKCASQLGIENEGAASKELLAKSSEWLLEDVELRSRHLRKIQKALEKADEDESNELIIRRGQLLDDLRLSLT